MNFVVTAVGVLSEREFSGALRYIVGMGNALLAQGHNVTIVTSKVGERVFRNLGLDAEFWLIDNREAIPETNLIRLSMLMIKRMFKAGFLLRKRTFSRGTVIFASCNLLWEVFPLLLIKDKTVIRISTWVMSYPNPFIGYRGAFTNKKKIPSLRESLAYLQYQPALYCMKYASDLIVSLPPMRHVLLDKGIPEEKIVTLGVGLERDIINAVVPSEVKYEACWIGRYNPQKGCDDLIEIWQMVSQATRGGKLAIMGNVADKLEPLVTKKNLKESFEFMGPVSEEVKYKVMKGSSIFLFPSYYEAVPTAVMEAMACGLPVVAYNLPVYKYTFPAGMVKVPIGDKEAFAKEVVNILSNKEKREHLSIEAANLASQFSWDEIVQRLILETNRLVIQNP